MDKTFEDIISETLEELTSDEESNNGTNLESETDNQSDEDTVENEESTEETEEDTNSTEETEEDEELDEENEDANEDLDDGEIEVTPNSSTNSKDANAFAKLRTENKKYKDTIEFFDQRAKAMGLAGIEDLMAKTQEAELKKEAEKQGIPLEYAKRLKELENRVAQQDEANANRQIAEQQAKIKNSLDGFVQANKLDNKSVQKLAKDLLNDGITLDLLSKVPENSIPRILKSYLPNELSKQKELEKKEKIKKELPLNSKSKTSTNTQEDEIDKIAKMISTFH
jgi:uncharacterized coiled-coil protein SlyX